MSLQNRYNSLDKKGKDYFMWLRQRNGSMATDYRKLNDKQLLDQVERRFRKVDQTEMNRISSRPQLAKWQKILKAQSTLMDFGMAAPQGSIPRADEDAQIKREMAQMEQTLNQNKGRIKTSVNQKVMDLATYRLEQLNRIKSMPFPQNVEEFNKFKEQYKQNF